MTTIVVKVISTDTERTFHAQLCWKYQKRLEHITNLTIDDDSGLCYLANKSFISMTVFDHLNMKWESSSVNNEMLESAIETMFKRWKGEVSHDLNRGKIPTLDLTSELQQLEERIAA